MVVGVVSARLFIRSSRSLKEKRQVVNSLKERLRAKFNVSVSEVKYQNEHQIAGLGVATVGSDRSVVEKTIQMVKMFLEGQPQATLSGLECEYY
ncbi:MAG: DUF503 domain-containing protein [Planctomycetota bacterium]|nr:DUF503 domain-containing protein [Planctomycetota bacterium]